jgi:hypothetical protein
VDNRRHAAVHECRIAIAGRAEVVEEKTLADAVVAFLTDSFAVAWPRNAINGKLGKVLVPSLIEPAIKTMPQSTRRAALAENRPARSRRPHKTRITQVIFRQR